MTIIERMKKGCDDCPYIPSVLIWTFYMALISGFIGSISFASEERFFNSRAYEWVFSLLPPWAWGFVWLGITAQFILAIVNWNYPYYAARWLRRQLTLTTLTMGVWALSIGILTWSGSLPAITAVMVWFGNVLATLLVLISGKFYRPEIAGKHYGTEKSKGILRWLQW